MDEGTDEGRAALLDAAEARFLDAALEEALAAPLDRRAAVTGESAARAASRSSRWLAAAVVLLGVGVVVAAAVGGREDIGVDSASVAQDPKLPEAVVVHDASRLAELDPATQNLSLTIASPVELQGLRRFADLRAVNLQPVDDRLRPITEQESNAWQEAGADAFDALLSCQQLERVFIGYFDGMDPAAVRGLGKLPRLHDVELVGVQHLVDAELVAGWGRAALRRIKLTAVRVTPDGLRALGELPLVSDLELHMCLHLERCDLRHLLRLQQLRRLSLRGVGGRLADSMQKTHPLPGEEAVPVPEEGPAVMHTGMQQPGDVRRVIGVEFVRGLQRMPALSELELVESVVGDEVLAALPTRLTSLDVRGAIGVTAAGVRSFARLERLERIVFTTHAVGQSSDVVAVGSEGVAAAYAEVLPKLPLAQIEIFGPIGAPLAEGLRRCRGLSRCTVICGTGDRECELGFVASLPALEELALTRAPQLDLDALRRAPALRRLLVRDLPTHVEAALREAFCAESPPRRPDGAPRLEVEFR